MIDVLQVGLSSNLGGIESCILNYHKNIDTSKVQFEYADIYGRGIACENEILQCGSKIYILPDYKKHPIRMAKELKKVILNNHYDVIHINMLSAANLIPVTIACRNSRGAVVVHSHNTAVPPGIFRLIMNQLNLHKLRNMPVKKWGCGLKAGKWMWGDGFKKDSIVPNAIEINKFIKNSEKRNVLLEQCGFSKDDRVLGFVGRFSKQKNVLFLAEILLYIKKKSPKYKLLLVGDGVLKKKLEEKFKVYDVIDRVYFAGLQKDVSAWYQAMDIFVLPSLFEGVPVVGIEAQAAGLPCFVSDKVSDEIDITGLVKYLPINRGGEVWADAVDGYLKKRHEKKNAFPKEYQIQYAAKQLEKRYEEIIDGQGEFK